MADSFQCMTKPTTIKKKKKHTRKKIMKWLLKKTIRGGGRDELGVKNLHVCTTVYKRANQKHILYSTGNYTQ